jgi:hypothetical protein
MTIISSPKNRYYVNRYQRGSVREDCYIPFYIRIIITIEKKEIRRAILSRMGSVYLDCYAIKFGDDPFFLVYHNPE